MRLKILIAFAAALAIAVAPAAAMAAPAHPPPTIGCSVSPACFDVFNAQLGPGDVLKVKPAPGKTAGAGTRIVLGARNGSAASEDWQLFPVGYATTTLNCPYPGCDEDFNFPFDNPFLDEFLIAAGDNLVFQYDWTPNGHFRQLEASLNSVNGLALERAGTFGSQRYYNGLWVASPLYQLNGSTPIINVGQTRLTGNFEVLGIPDGAQLGVEPKIQLGQFDSLGQVPENQAWYAEPNYP